MEHWNLDITGYRAGCQIERDTELSLSPPNCSNDS